MRASKGNSVSDFLTRYNKSALLQIWAALSLIPDNHGKNVRLDKLSAQTLLQSKATGRAPSTRELQSFLTQHFRSDAEEDPATNLFTDLLIFHGGDHIMFPGIMGNGLYVLSNMLTTIFNFGASDLPEQLVTNANHLCKLILGLSDRLAKHAGFQRYMPGTATDRTIITPNNNRLAALCSFVTISVVEMDAFLTKEGISKSALDLFIVDEHEPSLDSRYGQENPILVKPIYFDGNHYIILSPTNLAYALLDQIWLMADAWDATKKLSRQYHLYTWLNVQDRLTLMGFEPIKITLSPGNNPPVNMYWGLYRIDDDKIALVQYIFDDGANYDSSGFANFDAEGADKIKSHILQQLAATGYADYNIFDLSFISSVGRAFFVPIIPIQGAEFLNIPVPELDILSDLHDTNAIDLWKFAIVRRTKMPETQGTVFSFLDYFKLYTEHSHSFHISDDEQITYLLLEEGYGSKELLLKSKLGKDKHAVLRYDGDHFVYVTVELKDQYSPIYVSRSDVMSGRLYLLLEGLPQPLWIDYTIQPTPRELRNAVFLFTDAITYWLWQASEGLNPYLEQLVPAPLSISCEFARPEAFIALADQKADADALKSCLKVTIRPNGFHVSINEAIIPFLSTADNEGEREILRQLLMGFDMFLVSNNLMGIDNATIDKIVNSVAPLGLKKKIFIVNTANNVLLEKRHLEHHRYLQPHDTSEVLDLIIPLLGNKCPAVGPISDLESKRKLSYNIVAALAKELTIQISRYDCELLLQRLIAMIESLNQKREDINVTTPTRLACYQMSAAFVDELKEQRGRLSVTSISIRCLIEHIAAEQVRGNETLNVTVIDHLIALMEQIITWGMLGDQLNYQLFDIGISILPTGRIGTEKKEFNEIFKPYLTSKANEDIHDAKSTFKRYFDDREGIDDSPFPKNIDNAFLNDYGISFLRICAFIDAISELGIIQQRSYCSYEAATLLEAINNVAVAAFTQAEYNAAIDFLTLRFRGKVTNKPKGCDNFDISPWRFNRRLSLLRKPLVLLEPANGAAVFYWGFRCTMMTKRYLYDTLRSGRLKVADGSDVGKVMGKLANDRGDSLVDEVSEILSADGLVLETEVTIAPNGQFKHPVDIGDIDCLILDTSSRSVFSLECKAMAPSRNVKEMVEELSKLLGSESDRGWIDKHVRRHEWLQNNLQLVGAYYKVDISDYEIISVFVTREEMLSPHLIKDLALPFVTLYNIKENGIFCLHSLKTA